MIFYLDFFAALGGVSVAFVAALRLSRVLLCVEKKLEIKIDNCSYLQKC